MQNPLFERPDIARLQSSAFECLARVRASLDDARLDADLRTTLVAYWQSILDARERRTRGHVPAWSHGLGALFLMVMASEGAPIDELAYDGSTGCELYALSVTLFDAIQDDEVEGPIAVLSTPVCINAALIIFVKACESIFKMLDRLDAGAQHALRRALIARSMTLGRAQHRDLQSTQPASLELAAVQAQDKTDAIPMAAELAALAATCEPARIELYTRIARSIGLLNQSANDLMDLYGKRESDDLRAGRWTLPLVAHWEKSDAAQRDELLRLKSELPGSLGRIRELLLTSGAIHSVALKIERARRDVHAGIEQLGRIQAPIAILGAHADSIAARLYKVTGAEQ